MEIPELDTNGLRRFGLMLGGVLIVVLGIMLPWIWELDNLPNLKWIGGGVFVSVWALAAPDSIRGLYCGWMRITMMIGSVVNTLILAVAFFLVITPMAIVMRMMGKDPMRRALDKSVTNYRVVSSARTHDHMERPY